MMRAINPSQQKLAEKLTILNDRGIGMLTRLYNIKKNLNDPKSKPAFLTDKNLEPVLRQIVKRFPNVDTRTLTTHLSSVNNLKQDIFKSFGLYYYTFVDILDFKDHVCELLTTMDACQLKLDITVNFDLTKNYLDLIVTYVSLMILLSRIDDRKVVLGLYNTIFELMHSSHEQSFPRLSQLVIDYDNPMKKLSEEFVPHVKLLLPALLSLHHFFIMRNLPTDEWRKSQILSLVGNPAHLLTPTCTDSLQCEYLSLDSMERYIIFGFMLIHQSLNEQTSNELFFKALQNGWVTTLFRDEVILTHSFIQQFFDGIKGYSKRVSDVKDAYNYSLQNAGHIHRERRKFLRTALKELGLIFADQPGLLGPKVLLVFIGLSFARDEVNWLLRHYDNIPQRQGKPKASSEDLVDRFLPELLFHIEELRALVRKYNQVIQRYYVQFLTNYDAIALNQLMQNISMLPEDDSVILESIYQIISNLSVKQVENNEIFDFRGLRLDWFRLQAYTSVNHYSLNLFENKNFANLLNTIVFHTKVVDYLDEMLVETSNLSLFCFYNNIFDSQFHMCMEFPAQIRYIIAFPLICSHFMTCNHELCPEERHMVGERSLFMLNIFLDEMGKEAKNIIRTICDNQCILSDKLLPKHAAPQIAFIVDKKKNLKNRKDRKNKNLPVEMDKPGSESYRRSREEVTTMDSLHHALTELCYAINYCPSIHIWEHTFAPREYLVQHLENRFSKDLVRMVMYNSDSVEIAKPSELLNSVKTYMNVLQSIENYVHIDITKIFSGVILQQTQPQDSHGEKTITSLYTNWYLEVLLKKVSTGQIVFSPVQKAFVTLPSEQPVPFLAEEFSDVTELRALADLIGPYGIKYLNESLMWHVASQVNELKKLVIINKDILIALRSSYDKPEQMKELFKKLQNVDNVLQRMTVIGVILCFKGLIQEALYDNLTDRIPFLLSSIEDFKHNISNSNPETETEDPVVESLKHQIVGEMSSATGLSCKIDTDLITALKKQKLELNEDEYLIACHLIVFVAVSLPKLARQENSYYKPSLEAHANNIHCLAQAINVVAGALFTICKQEDTESRLKEFLALASSSLLRLGQETEKDAIKNRESVYILLDLIVKASPFLTMDLLENCFPYALLRNAYHAVYNKQEV